MWRFFLVLALVLVPTVSQAEVLPGVWKGMGDFSASGRGKFKNIPVEWTIALNESVMDLKECWKIKPNGAGNIVCSNLHYTVNAGKVFLADNTYVGTVSANRIELNYGVGGQSIFLLAGINGLGKFSFSSAQKNVKAKTYWTSQASNLVR